MKKIIVIHNIITPTRTILFNDMNKYFSSLGCQFKVIFLSATETNRKRDISQEIEKMNFEYSILNNKQVHISERRDNFFFHINTDIPKILNQEDPDIVIHAGRAGLSAWSSLFWCRKHNAVYMLWSESSIYEKSWRRTITKPIVSYLIRKANHYLSFGTRASEYLISLGAQKEKIYTIYNTVDIDYFIQEAKRLRYQKEILRKKYGINTRYVILFVGQLIKRKGIYDILAGFHAFQNNHPDISLFFLGEGPEQENLETIIKQEGINNVFFHSFVQQNGIGEIYTIADIFTLPSEEEVWGLVINEAMCFGLPIITAYKVGASIDLVQEGKNGYIMKQNTPCEFTKGLNYIFEKGLIKNNNSAEVIKAFRTEDMIKNIVL